MYVSSKKNVHLDVPQDCHFGPILFLSFFNDVTNVSVNSDVLLYANDFGLYKLSILRQIICYYQQI